MFNGKPIPDMPAHRAKLNDVDIGERVSLGIVREGREQTVTPEIAEAPAGLNAGLPARPPR